MHTATLDLEIISFGKNSVNKLPLDESPNSQAAFSLKRWDLCKFNSAQFLTQKVSLGFWVGSSPLLLSCLILKAYLQGLALKLLLQYCRYRSAALGRAEAQACAGSFERPLQKEVEVESKFGSSYPRAAGDASHISRGLNPYHLMLCNLLSRGKQSIRCVPSKISLLLVSNWVTVYLGASVIS